MELVIVLSIAFIIPTLSIIVCKYTKDIHNCINRRTSKFKFKLFEDNI